MNAKSWILNAHFPSLEKPRLSYASGITDHWSFLQTLKRILTRRCVRQWMLIFVPYNKLVYVNSSLWCCATAGARNYATPPPVLRAITGSASPLNLSAPAANLTPASSQVRRSTRYNAWSGLYFIDLFFDASSQLSGPVFIFSGSVCGDTVMQDRRLVVNAHPGFSKRADNRTWRRVDISVNSFRH